MPQHMLIRLGQDGELELKFKIRSTPVAELWVERMQARGDYPLDHPDRFYGFGTLVQEQARAVEYIQNCIATINAHEVIYTDHLSTHKTASITCTTYLNSYHGLLDQQTSDYWSRAPDIGRKDTGRIEPGCA
jgi:hypothetical protein